MTTVKERVSSAFSAMEELGLRREAVEPVLKNLLKLFRNEWSFIEAENYRLLADTVFDQEETEERKQQNHKTKYRTEQQSPSSSYHSRRDVTVYSRELVEKSSCADLSPSRLKSSMPLDRMRGQACLTPTSRALWVQSRPVENGTVSHHSQTETPGASSGNVSQKDEEPYFVAPPLVPALRSLSKPFSGDENGTASVLNIDMDSDCKLEGAQPPSSTLLLSDIPPLITRVKLEPLSENIHLPRFENSGIMKPPLTPVRHAYTQTGFDEMDPQPVVSEAKRELVSNCNQAQISGILVAATKRHIDVIASLPGPVSDFVPEKRIKREWPESQIQEQETGEGVDTGAWTLSKTDHGLKDDTFDSKIPAHGTHSVATGKKPAAVGYANNGCGKQQESKGFVSEDNSVPEVDEKPSSADLQLNQRSPAVVTPVERCVESGYSLKGTMSASSHRVSSSDDVRAIVLLERRTMSADSLPSKRDMALELINSKRRRVFSDSAAVSSKCIDPEALAQHGVPRGVTASNGVPTQSLPDQGLLGDNSQSHIGRENSHEVTAPASDAMARTASECASEGSGKNKQSYALRDDSQKRQCRVERQSSNVASCKDAVGSKLNKITIGQVKVEPVTEVDCEPLTVRVPRPVQRKKKPKHDPDDISRGKEIIPIPYVNEFNNEKMPDSFHYIPVNIVFQNAYVSFSLARIGDDDCCSKCWKDCLSAQFPCECARDTGGEFAYTKDGLLHPEFLKQELARQQDPEIRAKYVSYCQSVSECPIERAKNDPCPDKCKGHVTRTFVKECWYKCGCSTQCGNRVVQRGITRRLQVFWTPEGKGWGLQTMEDIPAGAFVCEYVGEILTNIELDSRNKEHVDGVHTYPILLDGDWCSERGLKDEEALCLDATKNGNVARFINHRCYDANLIDVPIEIESPDRHYYHVAFFTNRPVSAGEELTWDYTLDFEDKEHPIEAFKCHCGSSLCRGK